MLKILAFREKIVGLIGELTSETTIFGAVWDHDSQ